MIQNNDKIKVYNSLLTKISTLNKAKINSYAVYFCLKTFYKCGNIKNYTKLIGEISNLTGLTPRTTRTKLKELQEMELITIAKGSIYLTSFKKVGDSLGVNRLREPSHIEFTKLIRKGNGLKRESSFLMHCKLITIQRNLENQQAYVTTKRVQEIVFLDYLRTLDNNAQPRNDDGTIKQFKSIAVAKLSKRFSSANRIKRAASTAKEYWYKVLTKQERQEYLNCPVNLLTANLSEKITTKKVARERLVTNSMEFRNANLSVGGFGRLLGGSGQYWKSKLIENKLITSTPCIVSITDQHEDFEFIIDKRYETSRKGVTFYKNLESNVCFFKKEYISKCKKLVFTPTGKFKFETRKESVWYRRVLPCYINVVNMEF